MQREAARDGGARTAWPAAILNFREGGRMAERPHLLRRPVAGQTSDGWKTLCGVSLIEARHGFRLSRETEPALPVLGCEKCTSYGIAAKNSRTSDLHLGCAALPRASVQARQAQARVQGPRGSSPSAAARRWHRSRIIWCLTK